MHEKYPPQTTASLIPYSQLTAFSEVVPAAEMARLEEELLRIKDRLEKITSHRKWLIAKQEHVVSQFFSNGAYRGMQCTCGFCSSLGDMAQDQANVHQHLKDIGAFTSMEQELNLAQEELASYKRMAILMGASHEAK